MSENNGSVPAEDGIDGINMIRRCVAAGCSAFPLEPGTKRPYLKLLPHADDGKPTWRPYQQRLPTADEMDDWEHRGDQNMGVGIPHGGLNGNLGGLDADNPGFAHWLGENYGRADLDLAERGCWLRRTGSGKTHVEVRSRKPVASTVILGPDGTRLADLRGEGQYLAAEPSIHPDTHKRYTTLAGGPEKIAEVEDARALFLLLADKYLTESGLTTGAFTTNARKGPAIAVELDLPGAWTDLPTVALKDVKGLRRKIKAYGTTLKGLLERSFEDGSRSEPMHVAIKEMLKAGNDEQTVAAVLAQFAIGGKAREQGWNWTMGEIARTKAKVASESGANGPPATTPTVGGAVDAGAGGTKHSRAEGSQATRMVALVTQAETELFHTPDHEAYATMRIGEHPETWPLKSNGFKRWLNRLFYEAEGTAPGSQAVQDALCVLEGIAIHAGAEHPVYVRVAGSESAIYLDLADAEWRAVEITADGWRVVTDAPVKFRRTRGIRALPLPESGGNFVELRPFVNVASDEDWMLLVAWLVSTLRSGWPYPVLALHGEQGSAKSTTARVLRSLIDPNEAPLRSEPRDERDLVIAATNGWVVALDNLSHLHPWLSDALCRLATGGGFATRELHTNSDEVLFSAKRPIVLDGIEEIATRGDLLDRSIVVFLPQITDDRRMPEKRFWREFEAARPRILGALLDAVSTALGRLPSVHLDRLPRMADFAEWVVAAEPALGWEPGAFLDAYTGNRSDATATTLSASPVGRLLAMMRPGARFVGTVEQLRKLLHDQAVARGDSEATRRALPQTPHAMSNTLRRIAPGLRASGIEVEFGAKRSTGRLVRLERTSIASSPSSPTSPPEFKMTSGGAEQRSLGDEQRSLGDEQRSPVAGLAEMESDDSDLSDVPAPTLSNRSFEPIVFDETLTNTEPLWRAPRDREEDQR